MYRFTVSNFPFGIFKLFLPLQEGEYHQINDLGIYACNVSHTTSKFDQILSGLTMGTSDAMSDSKLITKTYMKSVRDQQYLGIMLYYYTMTSLDSV